MNNISYILLVSILTICLAKEALGMKKGSVEAIRGTVITKSFRPAVEPVPDAPEQAASDPQALQSQRLYERLPLLFDPKKGMRYREVARVGDDKKVLQNRAQLVEELSRQLRDQENRAADQELSEKFRAAYRNNAELLKQVLSQEDADQVEQ